MTKLHFKRNWYETSESQTFVGIIQNPLSAEEGQAESPILVSNSVRDSSVSAIPVLPKQLVQALRQYKNGIGCGTTDFIILIMPEIE